MLIKNEELVREFIETVVPVLENDEVFVYFVFGRKKYCPEIRNSHQMLYRDIIKTNDIDIILKQLKNIPTRFIDLKTKVPIKESCLSCYFNLNPKSMLKGYYLYQKQMNDLIYNSILNRERLVELRRAKKVFFSTIHKSNSRKPYILIDIDSKDTMLLSTVINSFLQEEIKWGSKTHGGYHIIINKTATTGKIAYQELKTKYTDIEIKGEVMSPIPGMLQGDFMVEKISIL